MHTYVERHACERSLASAVFGTIRAGHVSMCVCTFSYIYRCAPVYMSIHTIRKHGMLGTHAPRHPRPGLPKKTGSRVQGSQVRQVLQPPHFPIIAYEQLSRQSRKWHERRVRFHKVANFLPICTVPERQRGGARQGSNTSPWVEPASLTEGHSNDSKKRLLRE